MSFVQRKCAHCKKPIHQTEPYGWWVHKNGLILCSDDRVLHTAEPAK